jgi:hypothetical protein
MRRCFSPVVQTEVRDVVQPGLGSERVLFKYVRDKKRRKVGMCVALKGGRLGWSRCAKNRGDRFDRVDGYIYALRKAVGLDVNYNVPSDVKPVLEHLGGRAQAYFKEASLEH